MRSANIACKGVLDLKEGQKQKKKMTSVINAPVVTLAFFQPLLFLPGICKDPLAFIIPTICVYKQISTLGISPQSS